MVANAHKQPLTAVFKDLDELNFPMEAISVCVECATAVVFIIGLKFRDTRIPMH